MVCSDTLTSCGFLSFATCRLKKTFSFAQAQKNGMLNLCVNKFHIYMTDHAWQQNVKGSISENSKLYIAQKNGMLRPKIHGYTGCKRTGCVKPDSVKLAKGHLLHDEAGPWNRALQTPVPPWIQGLVCRVPCGWSVAVDPLSATVAPLHLTQFAVPFVQSVTTACKARDSTQFFTTCAMHGTWFSGLGLI